LPFFPLMLLEEVSQKLLYVSQTSLIYMWPVLFRKSEDIRHCELPTLLFWFGIDCCIRFCREPLESQRERSAPRSVNACWSFWREGLSWGGRDLHECEAHSTTSRGLLDNQRDEIEFTVMP
jgi:hypothetical protein